MQNTPQPTTETRKRRLLNVISLKKLLRSLILRFHEGAGKAPEPVIDFGSSSRL